MSIRGAKKPSDAPSKTWEGWLFIFAAAVAAIFIYCLGCVGGGQGFGRWTGSTRLEIAWRHASILVLLGLAAMSVGAFIGFLFGIPRALAGREAAADSKNGEPADRYTDNTNLQEISDWLTKIMVGVGLTQVSSLAARLSVFSAYAERQLDAAPGSGMVAITVAMVFGLGGFWQAYLWARTHLARQLAQSWLQGKLNEQEKDAQFRTLSLLFAAEVLRTRGNLPVNDPLRLDAIDRLTRLRQLSPADFQDRMTLVYLGRLYRQEQQYARAIEILTEGMKEIQSGPQSPGTTVALGDMLYNIACYQVKISEGQTGGGKDTTLNEARKNLRESFRLAPYNRNEAAEDPDHDLDAIKDVWESQPNPTAPNPTAPNPSAPEPTEPTPPQPTPPQPTPPNPSDASSTL